jgi:hypothetical protein
MWNISAHACFAIAPPCQHAVENLQIKKNHLKNTYLLFFWWKLRTITFFYVPWCSTIFMHFDNAILFWLPIPAELYMRGCPDFLTCGYRHLISSKCMMWRQAGMAFLCSANVLLESLPISVTVMYNLSICSSGFLQFVIFNLVMDEKGLVFTCCSILSFPSRNLVAFSYVGNMEKVFHVFLPLLSPMVFLVISVALLRFPSSNNESLFPNYS